MDINEFYNYICSEYPSSCVACNQDRAELESLRSFYYERLQWCDCGNPELALGAIRDYLNVIAIKDVPQEQETMVEKFGCKTIYGNRLLLCLAYALDAAGFTEHGAGIGGAWLTDEGKLFLFLLNRYSFDGSF